MSYIIGRTTSVGGWRCFCSISEIIMTAMMNLYYKCKSKRDSYSVFFFFKKKLSRGDHYVNVNLRIYKSKSLPWLSQVKENFSTTNLLLRKMCMFPVGICKCVTAELERIKKERAEEKLRKERLQAEERQRWRKLNWCGGIRWSTSTNLAPSVWREGGMTMWYSRTRHEERQRHQNGSSMTPSGVIFTASFCRGTWSDATAMYYLNILRAMYVCQRPVKVGVSGLIIIVLLCLCMGETVIVLRYEKRV